ncbi:hypothetical protein C8R42DRAFT_640004 [Lentinula raphanica]|nr:hypothetical protein C8R42DRAFT_640004 [Lentinula raphanica]
MAQAIQTLQAAEDRRAMTQVKLEHAGEFMAEIRELTDAGFNVGLEPFATSFNEAEAQLAKARNDFNAAEKSLLEAHGQATKAFERLQHSFSPSPEAVNPQASPASSQQLFDPPRTPARAQTRPGVAESPTPSSRTTSAHSDPTPSEESACGCQGLFKGYSATAKALSSNYEHRLMKKFQHEADATRSYNECEAGGILELLRPLPHSREIFIVAEGSLPGVYVTRLSLMIEGLDWRGGRVVSFVGTYQDAKSLFQEWDSSGQTRVLTGDISRLASNGDDGDVGDDGASLYEEFGLDSVTIISDDEDDLNESVA